MTWTPGELGPLSPTEQALFRCLGPGKVPDLDRRQWRAVAQRALETQCASLLWRRIRRAPGVSEVPSEVAARLGGVFAWSLARNTALIAERDRLGHVLADADVPVIVLKGADLATRYPSLGERPVGDIDLLIQPDRLEEGIRALSLEGYRCDALPPISVMLRGDSAPAIQRSGGFPVDLHWSIKGAGARAAAGFDGVWKRARPLDEGPCLGLDPEDCLVYVAMHLARGHTFATRNGLAGLADIGVLVEQGVDFDVAVGRAHEAGLACALHLVLRVARDLLGVKVPHTVFEGLPCPGWRPAARTAITTLLNVPKIRSLMWHLRPTLNPPPVASGVLGGVNRRRRLRRYILTAAFPPREVMNLEFRGLSAELSYPLHWAQLAVMHTGLLRRPFLSGAFSQAHAEHQALDRWLRAESTDEVVEANE